MVRLTGALLVLCLALNPAAEPEDPDLAAGVGLVSDGDFEGAVLRLDAAVRSLETGKGSSAALARAYLYLGISYLELDQEQTARGKFREALRNDPALRLDPRQFSPQVIRVFEATRQEAGLPASPATAAATTAPATTLPAPKKKRSATPILLIAGGGAAAAGIAAAAGGGGASGPATTTPATTQAPSTTTATTTTTTTTQPGATCSYAITPAEVAFSKDGGIASCQVRTSATCAWVGESTESWLRILGLGSGTGNGAIRFSADKNDGKARSGRIRLRGRGSVRCDVLQAGDGFAAGEASVALASDLLLAGGSGQLVVNGLAASFQSAGHSTLLTRLRPGDNRLEATVVTASGTPGTWRFELTGSVPPGSLRVLAGDLVQLTPTSAQFRVQGRAGERLVLVYGLAPGIDRPETSH